MRKYLLALLSVVFVLSVVSTQAMTLGPPPNQGVDEKCPAFYYPDTVGVILQYESMSRIGNTVHPKKTNTFSFTEFTELDGAPTWHYEYSSVDTNPNGKPQKHSMSVFQQVDNDVSQTTAFQYPNGNMIRLNSFFIDLKGPLVEGAAWEFTCAMPLSGISPPRMAEFEYKSTVEKTGVPVSTPAGQFTDCILVRELARSTSPVIVNCPDGTEVESYVQVDRLRYWAPFFGDVKETSTEWYGIDSSSDEACFTYSYSSELTKILANPK